MVDQDEDIKARIKEREEALAKISFDLRSRAEMLQKEGKNAAGDQTINAMSRQEQQIRNELSILRTSATGEEVGIRSSALKTQQAQAQSRSQEQKKFLADQRAREKAGQTITTIDLPARKLGVEKADSKLVTLGVSDSFSQQSRTSTLSESLFFIGEEKRQQTAQSKLSPLEQQLFKTRVGREALRISKEEIKIPLFIGAGGEIEAKKVKETIINLSGDGVIGKGTRLVGSFFPTTKGEAAFQSAIAFIPFEKVFKTTKVTKTLFKSESIVGERGALTGTQFVSRTGSKAARRGEALGITFFKPQGEGFVSRTAVIGRSGEIALKGGEIVGTKIEAFIGAQGAATLIKGERAASISRGFLGTSKGKSFSSASISSTFTKGEESAIVGLTASEGKLIGGSLGLSKKINVKDIIGKPIKTIPGGRTRGSFTDFSLKQQIAQTETQSLIKKQFPNVILEPKSTRVFSIGLTAKATPLLKPAKPMTITKPQQIIKTESSQLPKINQASILGSLDISAQRSRILTKQKTETRQKTQQSQIQEIAQSTRQQIKSIPMVKTIQASIPKRAIVPFSSSPIGFKGAFVPIIFPKLKIYDVSKPIAATRGFKRTPSIAAALKYDVTGFGGGQVSTGLEQTGLFEKGFGTKIPKIKLGNLLGDIRVL